MKSEGKALEGIRVLDVTQVMAGPFCAMQLCDMGADVIKVEPPEGDSTRRWAASGAALRGSATDGTSFDSAPFNALNRGKRGIVLNLKRPAAQEACRRLASRADILVENYRPGVMRAFGLDYDTLAADNTGLIYASVSGYGQTGPDAPKGGFDLVAQGVSGRMSITGEAGGPPVKIGVPLTDLGAGLFALSAILAALHYRTRTGRGQYIDTSLVDAGVALSVWEATEYFSTGVAPLPMGSAHRLSAPYQAIRCADGFITIAAVTDRMFEKVCGLLGHAEWVERADFARAAKRVQNRAALAALIEAETIKQPKQHWIGLFESIGVPCGPINTYDRVFEDPQIQAREMVVRTDHPSLGALRTLGSPMKMSATPPIVGRPAPMLGQHTLEVLREAGYSEDEIGEIVNWE